MTEGRERFDRRKTGGLVPVIEEGDVCTTRKTCTLSPSVHCSLALTFSDTLSAVDDDTTTPPRPCWWGKCSETRWGSRTTGHRVRQCSGIPRWCAPSMPRPSIAQRRSIRPAWTATPMQDPAFLLPSTYQSSTLTSAPACSSATTTQRSEVPQRYSGLPHTHKS